LGSGTRLVVHGAATRPARDNDDDRVVDDHNRTCDDNDRATNYDYRAADHNFYDYDHGVCATGNDDFNHDDHDDHNHDNDYD
jgi:hypothetical protein